MQAAAAASCVDIRDSEFNVGSGIYWLRADDEAYQAFCDMATEGGGWEVVIKQVGGPARPQKDNPSNRKLREGQGMQEPLLPPIPGRQSTHRAAVSKGYTVRSRQVNVDWLKVGHTFQEDGKLVLDNVGVADFGRSVSMADIFALSGGESCHK